MLDTATLGKTVGLMVTIFGGIIAMMLVLTGIGILLGKVFDDVRDYLWPVLTIAGSTLGLLPPPPCFFFLSSSFSSDAVVEPP